MDSVFRQVDCIELFVDDLDAGLAYCRDALGLALLWRSDTTLGLGMPEGLAFDIPIGLCAVVRGRWQNEYVILELSKGTYTTDAEGRVTGVS